MANQATPEGLAALKAAGEAAKARRAANYPDALKQAEIDAAFRKGLRTATEKASATPISEPSPSVPANTIPRDINKEAETAVKLGFSPSTPQEILNAAIMTYGTNLPGEFEALKSQLESFSAETAEDIKKGISTFGESALAAEAVGKSEVAASPMRLNLLQDALKLASGVGSQEIGQADIFQKAATAGTPELLGYGALADSLSTRSAEMDYKYDNFANVVKNIGDTMYSHNQDILNNAQLALNQYTLLRDEYEFERERLDQIESEAKQFEQQMQLLEQSAQIDRETWKYQYDYELNSGAKTWNQDLQAFVDNQGNIYYTDTEETPSGGASGSNTSNMTILGSNDPNAANCVKYARTKAPNLPYGLWNISDKEAIVNSQVPQVGSIVLTTESSPGTDTGHAAYVMGIDENGNLILDEANWKAGNVTQGRVLPADSSVILGYFDPNLGAQASVYSEAALDNPDRLQYEGVNPEGAEFGIAASIDGTSNLLTKAYESLIETLSLKGTSKANIANIKNSVGKSVESGDAETAKQKILNAAYMNSSATTQGEIDSRDDSIASLQEISTLIDEYTAKGGNLNIFTGTEEEIANKIGKTSDADLAALQTTMLITLQKYRQTITGAAASTVELPEYLKIMPNILSENDFNQAKIAALLSSLTRNQATTYKNNMGISLEDFYDLYPQYDASLTESTAATELSTTYTDYINQYIK